MIYCKATTMEINMLKQRVKLAWLKGGDNCSKIFFRKITARRASQRVYQIQNEDGQLLTEYTAVTGEFVNYFKKLFGGSQRQTQNLDHLQPFARYLISEDEATQITSPFQRHEIKEVLFDINEDSAPGPDGFSSGFFKSSWAVIGEDVCRAVMEFFNHDRLLKQLNTTLITLIPKVQLPTKVGDFRPIACCNVIYKIITKIMVKRMQLVLEKLVDNCQNAFVPGRSISIMSSLLKNYYQATIRKNCLPGALSRLIYKKAYDMVNWDYLLVVLRLFRFPNRFILWVEQCITTASFSISLNGTIHGFFSSTQGLRQGDPISPYLFVLVMESLHLLIKNKIQNDDNFQFHWRCKEMSIVNLCFADDLLLFCKADIHSATVLHGVLQELKGRAGLQANAQKIRFCSQSSSTNTESDSKYFWISTRYVSSSLSWVPLITSKLSLADCAPLILKIEARIAGWNQLKLTYAGRTQLIKSVLSSIHQYWCSVFILPKGVIKLIKGIQFQVGDGTEFKLWLDPWHPDGTLLHRYPHGPLITGLPMDSPLSTVIARGNWQWPSEHHVDINDIVTKLPDIHRSGNDAVIWKSSSGTYTTETAYAVFSSPSNSVEWAPLLHGPFLTPRHNFILWLAILEQLSTLDKPWCNSTNQGCVLCDGYQNETHNHLFFCCTYSKAILHILGSKLRFHWPYTDWKMGIKWASKKWRGSHLVNAAHSVIGCSSLLHMEGEKQQNFSRNLYKC
ncbi:UNVERIFIED_CONTAM: hypothetical protein Scaly_3154100 [Sesamum calycinum]|uniref:Reverse transcriptase domain-containing protein n=1 Tax=Sesamum calycinum TaxID=2727403 RepID=A0AAW2JEC3_9LAMI